MTLFCARLESVYHTGGNGRSSRKLCERIVMPIVHDFIPVLSRLLALSRSTVLVVVVMVVVVKRNYFLSPVGLVGGRRDPLPTYQNDTALLMYCHNQCVVYYDSQPRMCC